MFKIGTFAIIFDEQQRVLLCHRRDYDFWNLPGGGLEAGESPWQGCIREVREEVGLEVEVERLAGVYSKPDKGEIVFTFVCRVIGGEITNTDEADRAEYFGIDNLPGNTLPKQVERIRDTMEGRNEVVLKVQSGPSVIDMLREDRR
jgi:8-oxo-dGTP diphosphatase